MKLKLHIDIIRHIDIMFVDLRVTWRILAPEAIDYRHRNGTAELQRDAANGRESSETFVAMGSKTQRNVQPIVRHVDLLHRPSVGIRLGQCTCP